MFVFFVYFIFRIISTILIVRQEVFLRLLSDFLTLYCGV